MNEIIYLSLEGHDHHLNPQTFSNSLRGFTGLLKELDSALSQNPSGAMRWEIASLTKASPATIGIAGHTKKRSDRNFSGEIFSSCVGGLNLLSQKPERLPIYSDRALARTEYLAKLRMVAKIDEMRIISSGHEASIDISTLSNIQKLRGVEYQGSGSVTGTLDSITVHNNNEFRVWSEVTNKPVTCKFDDSILNIVKDRLKQRVLVYGLVKWNHLGHPISVTVQGVEDVDKGHVPTIEEMSGLFDDFTNGKSLKDYMEELRNG